MIKETDFCLFGYALMLLSSFFVFFSEAQLWKERETSILLDYFDFIALLLWDQKSYFVSFD